MGSIRRSTFVMNKLLRDNVTLLSNRVFPPGMRIDAQVPRAILHAITPPEQFAAMGSGLPTWRLVNFRLDIYARNPAECDSISEQVEDAISSNRTYGHTLSTITMIDYTGKSTTVAPCGYFLMLKINGGTETAIVPAMNLFHRAMIIAGRWLSTA